MSSPRPSDPTLPAPERTSAGVAPIGRVGAYELLIELASGGMATVYLARAVDRRQGTPLVAIKRPHRHLASERVFLSMLVDEARLASTIEHESVVKVRELGFEGGIPFIVMDYVEGASLAELRKELSALGRAFDVRIALRIALDALAGLHAAHELRDENGRHLGIIHRDVSPHNVLIGCDGRARLTDFGIAKAEDRVQITRTHEVKGKLAYMAPERIDKRRICSVQGDVFSMAVVLWECLAGRRLFRGEDAVDTLQEVMTAPIPSLRQLGADISPELDLVIARGLSRDLEVRYASAKEFAQALERAAGPSNIGSREDVARLVEAMFGSLIALRHEHVRATIGDEIGDLLARSGLPARDQKAPVRSPPSGKLLESLAPPAPSARYSFGTNVGGPTVVRRVRARRSWWMAAGFTGAAAFGLIVGLVLMPRSARTAGGAAAIVPTAAPSQAPPPTTRRVVLPLPFVVSRVQLDDEVHELSPPADVATFELPATSGQRHRVVAVAADGARVEGFGREEDGVVVAEGEGYTIMLALPPVELEPPPPPRKPVGTTMKNGFTKLK